MLQRYHTSHLYKDLHKGIHVNTIHTHLSELSFYFELIEDEIIERGMECLDGSSAVFHVFEKADVPAVLMRGILNSDCGSIIVPHYWVVAKLNHQDIIVDVTQRLWLGDDNSTSHCVFLEEDAKQNGLEYDGTPQPDDVDRIDSELVDIASIVSLPPDLIANLQ